MRKSSLLKRPGAGQFGGYRWLARSGAAQAIAADILFQPPEGGTVFVTGTASLDFATQASASAMAAMSGQASLSFTASGSTGTSALSAAYTSLAFATSGALTATAALAGQSGIGFTATASPSLTVPISGTASLGFSASGVLIDLAELDVVPPTPGFGYVGVNPVRGPRRQVAEVIWPEDPRHPDYQPPEPPPKVEAPAPPPVRRLTPTAKAPAPPVTSPKPAANHAAELVLLLLAA